MHVCGVIPIHAKWLAVVSHMCIVGKKVTTRACWYRHEFVCLPYAGFLLLHRRKKHRVSFIPYPDGFRTGNGIQPVAAPSSASISRRLSSLDRDVVLGSLLRPAGDLSQNVRPFLWIFFPSSPEQCSYPIVSYPYPIPELSLRQGEWVLMVRGVWVILQFRGCYRSSLRVC